VNLLVISFVSGICGSVIIFALMRDVRGSWRRTYSMAEICNGFILSIHIHLKGSNSLQVTSLYRVIKKSLCTWWLQHRKLQVMFKVSPTGHQTFIDTPNCVLEYRVQHTNYVIMVSDWSSLKYFCMLFFTVIIRCTETFWSSYIMIWTLFEVGMEMSLVCWMCVG
jgi:hypothetical protein